MKCAHSLVGLCFFLLTSCSAGVSEFQAYSNAFELQNVEAQAVLDKLARDEREVWLALNDNSGTPVFSADNARYYIDSVDPPLTGSIRETLAAVQQFNRALVALSDGTRSSVVSDQLLSLMTNVAQAEAGFNSSQNLALGADVGGFASISARVKGRLALVGPLLSSGLSIGSRAEFRRTLVEAYPPLRAALVELKPVSEAIYRVFLAQNISSNAPRSEQLTDRALVASWVILIEETIDAMDIAVAAAQDTSSRAHLSNLLSASIELRVLAETLHNARQ